MGNNSTPKLNFIGKIKFAFSFAWLLQIIQQLFDFTSLKGDGAKEVLENAANELKKNFGRILLTPDVINRRLEFERLVQKAGGFMVVKAFLEKQPGKENTQDGSTPGAEEEQHPEQEEEGPEKKNIDGSPGVTPLPEPLAPQDSAEREAPDKATPEGAAPGQGAPQSRFLWLLDAGHGGIAPATGRYTTAPSKMWEYPDFTFYEGVYNRAVLEKLEEMCQAAGIEYAIISHPWQDTPLAERTRRVNEFCQSRECILLSIHGNAAGKEATGFSVWTSPGQTQSDEVAEVLFARLKANFPGTRFMQDTSDGDSDFEARFWMLTKSNCPAVLSENGFFTNHKQARDMLTEGWQHRVAKAHFETILQVEREKCYQV